MERNYYIPDRNEFYEGFNFEYRMKTEHGMWTVWTPAAFLLESEKYQLTVNVLLDDKFQYRVSKLHPDDMAKYNLKKEATDMVDPDVVQFFLEHARHNQGHAFFVGNMALTIQPDGDFHRVIIANGAVVPPFMVFNGRIRNDNELRKAFQMVGLIPY